ncbi:DUF2971 domain-containing protein [uncultured Algoriphagus sp.]|uniref:DUF2971 domain-containing protein n=1 Tax=uncultured Algoriphagus sp. TaxID=417365 RepID=UPI0030EDB0DC|tara:strand:+ start:1193 stop:2026 length:834 start_codon:yes stop_codon:yes gene_type:complete
MTGELLYHYTSIESLHKILLGDGENIVLRATHANFMNDPDEFEFANKIITKTLLEYESENSVLEKKSDNLFGKGGIFGSFAYLPGEPFILSLSEHQDDLSMWRAYGHDGNGVCIGLDKEMLKSYSEDPEVINTTLLECEYRKEIVENHFRKYWINNYNDFKIEKSEDGRITTGFNDGSIFFSMPKYGFSAKSPSYGSEAEWRLCTNEGKNYQFRTKGNLFVPFIEHKFRKEILKKIVIGPCLNGLQVEQGMRFFLKKFGFPEAKAFIERSQISYRQV